MIKIENLQKIYDNSFEALKKVNLEIPTGSLVCLLGPSGCGKSTMLNLVAGLLDPTSGDILVDGKSIVNLHPKDRNIGMVFQNYALYPHMTVMENVTFPLTVGENKLSQKEAEKKALPFMELTDILTLKDKRPNALSGGQQQRVAIARVLVQNPKILLLDEPLSNLDARLRLKIREEIRNIVKKVGVTTIFVTHDQEEALSIGDYIAVMNDGIIQQYGIPQELYLQPENLFVAKFIGNPIINVYDCKFDGQAFKTADFSIPKEKLKKDRFKEELSKGSYKLAIRPEHFYLRDKDPDFSTTISSIEMIGRYMIVHFNLNGKASRMVVDSSIKLKAEDMLNVGILYQSIYIFDSQGRRLY